MDQTLFGKIYIHFITYNDSSGWSANCKFCDRLRGIETRSRHLGRSVNNVFGNGSPWAFEVIRQAMGRAEGPNIGQWVQGASKERDLQKRESFAIRGWNEKRRRSTRAIPNGERPSTVIQRHIGGGRTEGGAIQSLCRRIRFLFIA
jgi:hypothetical protein